MLAQPYLRRAIGICKRLKLSAPLCSVPLSDQAQPFSTVPSRRRPVGNGNNVESNLSINGISTASLNAGLPETVLSGQDQVSEPFPYEADMEEDRVLPRSVQAIYLKPLKRPPTHGLPVCDLQLRSYSVRNLEFMADFALRVAYYLHLPASGPVPLPRITERWTVPKSNFIYKKAQENFERITLRRLIQIKDGNTEVVQAWLAFLRKHAYYGVGMKANVWEYEGLSIGESMDTNARNIEKDLEASWSRFARLKSAAPEETLTQLLSKEGYKGYAEQPMTDVLEEGMKKEIGHREKKIR